MSKFEDMISNQKIEKVLKGAGISALVGMLTFFLGYIDVYDVGIATPIAVSAIGICLNILKAALTKYEPEK